MITFACSSCQKKFSVKDELAGKKGQCPGCGQLAAIPSPVVSRANAEMATLPPAPGPAPSHQNDRTNVLTHPPSSDPDATQGVGKPKAGHDASLTDFLAPPQAEDELGRLGKYRIVKILGHGGMGVVFQAEDPKLKRSVAVKAMLPALAASASAGQRFLREAQAMAAVKHDHIATIYQVDEERGVPFLAMEFLAGEPLDERLKRDGKLPLADVLRIGREIAEGLDAAHATGLIHRDVKPANIWLEAPNHQVKILDFGLARAAKDDGHLTQEGAIVGTPAYMAPEQARGEKVDGRCDLFSLGGVLYRMLTGEQPFKGSDTMSLLMALAADEPRPVRELRPDAPPALADLVKRLLAKDAGSRPESARAAADALAEMEDHGLPMPPLGPDATAPVKRVKASAKRREKAMPRWLLPVAGGGLLLAVLGGVILIISPPVSKKTPPGVPETNEWGKEIENSIGMRLVRIPAGKFTMGSPADEKDRHPVEEQHAVEITKVFWLGVHEVTQKQFKEVMGYNPSYFSQEGKGKEGVKYGWSPARGNDKVPADASDFPVENVSWEEAKEFCEKVTKKEGGGRTYRLPNEAEWEYSCRGGANSSTAFHTGNSLSSSQANIASKLGHTCKVGSYKANGYGLFDMHGNVWEWCGDWYDSGYYGKSPPRDPVGPLGGSYRVFRGGSWSSGQDCRSARRGRGTPAHRSSHLGFRVALVPSVPAELPAVKVKLQDVGNRAGQKQMIVEVSANPKTVAPGETITITVTVRAGDRSLLPGVNVTISAGGGKFLTKADAPFDPKARLHGPYSATGTSNAKGEFTTWWVVNPAASGYGLGIKASKEGYVNGKASHTIKMERAPDPSQGLDQRNGIEAPERSGPTMGVTTGGLPTGQVVESVGLVATLTSALAGAAFLIAPRVHSITPARKKLNHGLHG